MKVILIEVIFFHKHVLKRMVLMIFSISLVDVEIQKLKQKNLTYEDIVNLAT